MRNGGFVSIGWRKQVPDLTEDDWRRQGRRQETRYGTGSCRGIRDNPGVASRKAGEILNFAQEIAEKDLVLACEGQTVLG